MQVRVFRKSATENGTFTLKCLPLVLAIAAASGTQAGNRTATGDRVQSLTRESAWKLVKTIPIRFTTFHPQGMVMIGDVFHVSSVEVKARTKRYPRAIDGYDRDTGEGIGHLFKIDANGNLLADLRLGEGAIYHPGGIDFDGRSLWVPVAEYRPNSRSIIYRVDPDTMKATEVFRFADHIGALVYDTDEGALHGVSWGSRRYYRWTMSGDGRVTNATVAPDKLRTLNPSHYVDYQDCKYAGRHRMLCTGVTEIMRTPDADPFRLGGMDLIDLTDGHPLHQVPVLLWTTSGMDMTHNPAWITAIPDGLRAYFMPEDDRSTIFIYELKTD